MAIHEVLVPAAEAARAGASALKRRPRVWLQARVLRLPGFEEISVTAHMGNRDEHPIELDAATLFWGKERIVADDPRSFIDARPIQPRKSGFVVFLHHRLAPHAAGRDSIRVRARLEDPTKQQFWSPPYRLDLKTGQLQVRGWRRLLPARYRE